VKLHLTALDAQAILKLAARRIECIANGNENILVRVVLRGIAAHDDMPAGDVDIDGYAEQFSLSMMLVRGIHGHAAADDAIGEFLELRRTLANFGFDRVGPGRIVEMDLKRYLHLGTTPSYEVGCISAVFYYQPVEMTKPNTRSSLGRWNGTA
jgi:hypothetical protein